MKKKGFKNKVAHGEDWKKNIKKKETLIFSYSFLNKWFVVFDDYLYVNSTVSYFLLAVIFS